MRRLLSLIFSFILVFSNCFINSSYAYERDSMQGAWITTVYNSDWPKVKGNINAQKQEMINILDTLKQTGINTIMFQVRTQGDALYKSNINPWSSVLTGTQGKDPGYDPLQFVIEEAHKRNMKVHAWLNPYRVTTSGTDLNVLSKNHQARKNPSWVLTHNNKLYFNPELEEVKNHIVETVAEIVNNYDIDGIHFDDYFYPSGYPLPQGENKDGIVANSRRNHITDMINRVNQKIKSIKSDVEFGISPSGIWKNNRNDSNGSNTNGKESYYSDYADTRLWVKQNMIDYIVPQIYWETGHKSADYETLVKWWNDVAYGTNVDLYIGHGIYKDEVSVQIDKQLEIASKYENVDGSIYYTTRDILNNRQGAKDKIKSFLDNYNNTNDNSDDNNTNDDNINSEGNQILNDINNHWAKESILLFLNNGFVGGYEDNTFKPDNQITRAEFVKLINKVYNLTNSSGKVFDDTINHWAKNEIDIAYTNKVASGKSENEFRPDDFITREEAVSMISNIEKIWDENTDKVDNYTDGYKVSSWAKSSVEASIEKGYLGGYSDNTIRPQNNLTRAEAVVMLQRTMNKSN